VQDKLLTTLDYICEKIGTDNSGISISNMIISLTGDFKTSQNAIFKLLKAFAAKIMDQKDVIDFLIAYNDKILSVSSPISKKILAQALASLGCKVDSK
jgi:hypothetical protein